jgi:transcriptional regulator with XRE-family HTH domain
METTPKPRHIGRNISRLRELRGMKQEALAIAIGVSQQTISLIEKSEEEKLVKIAEVLGVSVEAVRNFSEEGVINIINNTFSDFKDNASAINYNSTFNALDKLMEMVEENRNFTNVSLMQRKKK